MSPRDLPIYQSERYPYDEKYSVDLNHFITRMFLLYKIKLFTQEYTAYKNIIKHLHYDGKNSFVHPIKYLFNNKTVLSDSIKNLFAIWQTHQQCILNFIGQNNFHRTVGYKNIL